MNQMLLRTVVGCVAAMAASPALGHDFWIAPTAFHSKAGERIDLTLRVGHLDNAEDVKRDSTRIEQFSLLTPDGTKSDVLGQDRYSPAGVIRPHVPGLNIVIFDSNTVAHTMDSAKFEAYLKEEGLERIVAERAKRGESGATGVETYSRCAKSLIWIDGDAPASSSNNSDRATGMRLELIAAKSPGELKPGDDLSVQLLFDGKPIEGVKIVAANTANATADDPEGQVIARSDADGRAPFKLPVGGMWMIHAVHMTRLPEEAEADWESIWTSLTFEIGKPRE